MFGKKARQIKEQAQRIAELEAKLNEREAENGALLERVQSFEQRERSIARALTEALVGLGAHVTVASRSAIHRNQAIVRGAQTVSTGMLEAALPDARLVFSTAPAMVLDEAMLCYVARDAMLIDLASPPYGVNLYAAWNRGIRAWREPALPGRYCPRSAARALLNAIDRSERGGDRND